MPASQKRTFSVPEALLRTFQVEFSVRLLEKLLVDVCSKNEQISRVRFPGNCQNVSFRLPYNRVELLLNSKKVLYYFPYKMHGVQ
jgi:hypothetical protein